MFILKLLLLILILGLIILVHEFGHFIWAKTFKVHIYEFSIGMGPLLHTHKGKDGIDYNIRAIPIGGFVAMAGEVYDDDDKIDKKALLCNKPAWQRLIILAAGVMNNFIMAILILIVYTAIWGGGAITPQLENIQPESAAEKAGLKANDTILSINGYKTSNWDKAQIILYYKNKNNYTSFEIKHDDGTVETINVTPDKVVDPSTKEEREVYGIQIKSENTKGVFKVIGYGFKKFYSILDSFVYTIWGLISGKISIDALSGPVGMYTVVGDSLSLKIGEAIEYLLYLLAYLSINVGFINILPFPAFDGGHILFVLIEKIKGSPVNSKFESICHLIGFILIFTLMIIVSIKDIIKLF